MSKWNGNNVLKVQSEKIQVKSDPSEFNESKEKIEPWLTALFQSDHISLLVGSGLSTAVQKMASEKPSASMNKMEYSVFSNQIQFASNESAKKTERGTANIEDQIRIANDLLRGLEIYISEKAYGFKKLERNITKLKKEINNNILKFAESILGLEKDIIGAANNKEHSTDYAEYLMNFLVSFASRSSTRERLNIFTINYDRVVEFGAELAGIRLIDRFVGTVFPIFRSSRLEVDIHYNPPGIRGEPRYLEGVVHFTKLHGSLDWIYQNGNVRRMSLPFGAEKIESYMPSSGTSQNGAKSLMIYPNSSKDRETSEYPYVELFRDLAAAICRPNSTLVLYGYSFGDEHINRVISDMLTIPSSHLVIISFSDEGNRIEHFFGKATQKAQISLLIGNHYGDLKTLVDKYLPKPAIDRTTFRMVELLKSRGFGFDNKGKQEGDKQ